MNEDDKKNLDKLITLGFINTDEKEWNHYNKMIAVRICQDDLKYIRNYFVTEAHYLIHRATIRYYTGEYVPNKLIKYMFAIACSFSSDKKILKYLTQRCEILRSTFRINCYETNSYYLPRIRMMIDDLGDSRDDTDNQ